MIRKSVMTVAVLLILVLVAGCLDYKTYDSPEKSNDNLVTEIAEIERELGLGEVEDGAEDNGDALENNQGADGSSVDSADAIAIEEDIVVEEKKGVLSFHAKKKQFA